MQKIFYVSKSSDANAPDMDKFRRVEKLNNLISLGWEIKEMKVENEDTYFVLEKEN